MGFCSKCGNQLPEGARVCQNCGEQQYIQNAANNNVLSTADNQQGGSGMAVASMVLGIVATLCGCCFYYVAFPCSLVGLILGGISIAKKKKGKGMAIAGIVMCILSLAVAIVCGMLLGVSMLSS